jgi:hypothetical protein
LRVQQTAQGVLAAQASFAASLISYRLGLQGYDLPMPKQYLDIPSSSLQRLEFVTPPKMEADLFEACLAQEPYGIELSKDLHLQFSCPGGQQTMIGFNSGITGGKAIEFLQQRKTFLGIVATKNSENGRYSASYLIFTAPHIGKAKAEILIYRITGEPAWAGTTTSITANQAKFTIRTVGRIGIVPMEIDGVVNANGEIKITAALIANRVTEKRHPKRLDSCQIFRNRSR